MSVINIQFKDFTFLEIHEEYNEDYVFGSTFHGDECVELLEISLMLSYQAHDIKIHIKPYPSHGYYGGYSDTGHGLSTKILADIIKILQDPSNIEFYEFLSLIINEYQSIYNVEIEVDGRKHVALKNSIVIQDDEFDVSEIINVEHALVIDLDDFVLNLDEHRIEYLGNEQHLAIEELTSLKDNQLNRLLKNSSKEIHYTLMMLYLKSHKDIQNLVVVDKSKRLDRHTLDKSEHRTLRVRIRPNQPLRIVNISNILE